MKPSLKMVRMTTILKKTTHIIKPVFPQAADVTNTHQMFQQKRRASNIGISQSTFSVKVLNLFSRSRRKTNKHKSKHSAMLRNKETRHRMFIGLLNTTRKLA